MQINRLMDHDCRKAVAGDTVRKIYDGGGLYLAVLPSGSKVWRIAYRFGGRPTTLVLGNYPALSLSAARARRAEIKVMIRNGADPAPPKALPPAPVGKTLGEAVKNYWVDARRDITDGYRGNVLRGIEMHLEELLSRPIRGIGRDDLLAPLQRMDAAGRHVYVRKVRMWIGQVFDWAVENRHADSNPAALIRPERAFGREKVAHFPALDLREVPGFVARLEIEQDIISVLACWMLAYTWARTHEMRMMEWSEIDGDTWIIPAGKMKRARDHVAPLSRQAMAILDEMRTRGAGPYEFSAHHRFDRPLSENTILALIARMGYRGRMTGHGWRTVASTWANDRGYSSDAIERQLSHVPDDKVRSAYNRAEYLPIRREMLQAWADWLDGFKPG
jgi:integrase